MHTVSFACFISFLRSALLKEGDRTANVRADATCKSLRSCATAACSLPHLSLKASTSPRFMYRLWRTPKDARNSGRTRDLLHSIVPIISRVRCCPRGTKRSVKGEGPMWGLFASRSKYTMLCCVLQSTPFRSLPILDMSHQRSNVMENGSCHQKQYRCQEPLVRTLQARVIRADIL